MCIRDRTKVGLEKTDETIIQLRVEVEAKINQIGNHNDTRVKEIQAKTDVYKRQCVSGGGMVFKAQTATALFRSC